MPPPSPVWARDGKLADAVFWFKVTIGKTTHTSEMAVLRVKGADKKVPE